MAHNDYIATSARMPRVGFSAMSQVGRGAIQGRAGVVRRFFPGLVVIASVTVLLWIVPVSFASPPVTITSGDGSGAGQVDYASGVAIDESNLEPSSGDIYVSESNNRRLDKFSSAGSFLEAWGGGVAEEPSEQEQDLREHKIIPFQTCTLICYSGAQPTTPGSMRPSGVAVDNGPLSSSYHDVYVADSVYRVQKFGPNGEFLWMAGKGVDAGPHHPGDLCTAANVSEGDTCGPGSQGSGQAEFSNESLAAAVDGAGNVWVGDTNRIEEFSSAGVFLSEVTVPGVGWINAVAVDIDPSSPSFDDLYVVGRTQAYPTQGLVPYILKLSPTGTLLETIDEGGHPDAVTVDPATGDLFVSDLAEPGAGDGKATLLEYNPSGKELDAFATGQVAGHPLGEALAFADSTGRLYVASSSSGPSSTVQSFGPPAAGPYLREGSLAAVPRPSTAALKATLRAEGAETKYHFEYVSEEQFDKESPGHGFDHAIKTATGTLLGDFAEHEVTASISGLKAETAYRVRILAENANGVGNAGDGSAEAQAQFATLPPALVEAQAAYDVTADSATIQAEINTLEESDEYQFEYITESAYQRNADEGVEPFADATLVPQPGGILAPIEGFQAVSQHLQGLTADSAYRYRVTVRGPGGVTHGPSSTFTTEATGGFVLPDGRVWELVSPQDKYGAGIRAASGVSQAAVAGDAITYQAGAPIEAQPPGNLNSEVQAVAGRTTTGWKSLDINMPHENAPSNNAPREYPFFSSDLSLGLLRPAGAFVPSLSSEASEQTPFLRADFVSSDPAHLCASSCYTPLVSSAPGFENVPSGTVFGGATNGTQASSTECVINACGPEFEGANLDASAIILSYQRAPLVEGYLAGGLDEWVGGRLSFVTILPDKQAAGGGLGAGTIGGDVRNAVSSDGSRVVWSSGGHLYLRDMGREASVQLDEVQGGSGVGSADVAEFQTAASDGSRVFFTDSRQLTNDSSGASDLYECQIVEEAGELKCRLTDLTGNAGVQAGVMGAIAGASEDGSYVYFVASGVLTGTQANRGEKAIFGQPNLYMRHAGVTRLIGVLSPEDKNDWENVEVLSARVSPDGHWFAFMSARSITGYDNRDLASGKHDEEVFLYHADQEGEGNLVCASCNPTGGRPDGVEWSKYLEGTDLKSYSSGFNYGRAIAGVIPGWTSRFYQSRYLSNSGRLFFDSFDALVAQDTNGADDAYQFEPSGVGDCTLASATFVVASNGCIGLISSGTSKEGSSFLDASESGRDIFFLTTAQLSASDTDSAIDIYDAHECGTSKDCSPPPPTPVPACEGDACQTPVAAPEDPTPGSLTYQGPGNPPALVLNATPNPKSKTVKCKKSTVERHGKCVKSKAKKRTKKAKRSNRRGR